MFKFIILNLAGYPNRRDAAPYGGRILLNTDNILSVCETDEVWSDAAKKEMDENKIEYSEKLCEITLKNEIVTSLGNNKTIRVCEGIDYINRIID